MEDPCGHGKNSRVWDCIVPGYDAVSVTSVAKQHITFTLKGLEVRAFFKKFSTL